jgi:hypothetical protein
MRLPSPQFRPPMGRQSDLCARQGPRGVLCRASALPRSCLHTTLPAANNCRHVSRTETAITEPLSLSTVNPHCSFFSMTLVLGMDECMAFGWLGTGGDLGGPRRPDARECTEARTIVLRGPTVYTHAIWPDLGAANAFWIPRHYTPFARAPLNLSSVCPLIMT